MNEGYFLYTEELWSALTCMLDTCALIKNLCLAAVVDADWVRLLTEYAGLIASQWPEYAPKAKRDNDNADDD